MRQIQLKNLNALSHLSNIIREFNRPEIIELVHTESYRVNDNLIPDIHSCSDEYFHKARTFPIGEFGYPRSCWGISQSQQNLKDYNLFETVRTVSNKFAVSLGIQYVALLMIYPDDGYIGWHHNGNAPGYNILFTHSVDGDGYFKYYDYDKEDFVVLQDQPGWNVRVGYYADQQKTDKVFWHCAETKKRRITLGFIINHKNSWQDLIDCMENEY